MKKKDNIATGGIAEECRKLRVGEAVLFPLSKYKYNSVRNSISTTLMNDRVQERKKWTAHIDWEREGVVITRTS